MLRFLNAVFIIKVESIKSFYFISLVRGDGQWVGGEQGAGRESAQWAPETPAGPADSLPGEQ